jgi:hypothetical protein
MNAETGDLAIGAQGIAVPLTARDGERYVAHVLPLTSGHASITQPEFDGRAVLGLMSRCGTRN